MGNKILGSGTEGGVETIASVSFDVLHLFVLLFVILCNIGVWNLLIGLI